jgi:hypothetical protein
MLPFCSISYIPFYSDREKKRDDINVRIKGGVPSIGRKKNIEREKISGKI